MSLFVSSSQLLVDVRINPVALLVISAVTATLDIFRLFLPSFSQVRCDMTSRFTALFLTFDFMVFEETNGLLLLIATTRFFVILFFV